MMWQEAEFMQAVESYSDGYSIKCIVFDKEEFVYTPNEDAACGEFGFMFIDEHYVTSGVSTAEILEGQWFVWIDK